MATELLCDNPECHFHTVAINPLSVRAEVPSLRGPRQRPPVTQATMAQQDAGMSPSLDTVTIKRHSWLRPSGESFHLCDFCHGTLEWANRADTLTIKGDVKDILIDEIVAIVRGVAGGSWFEQTKRWLLHWEAALGTAEADAIPLPQPEAGPAVPTKVEPVIVPAEDLKRRLEQNQPVQGE